MDRGAWWATVHEVAKNWKQVINTVTLPHIHSLYSLPSPYHPSHHTHILQVPGMHYKNLSGHIFSTSEVTKVSNHFWLSLKYSYHCDIKIEGKNQPPENAARLANPIILSNLMFISTQSKIVCVILAWLR